MATIRWNSHDLEMMPDDGKRYEVVDGELYMSRQPHWEHQFVSNLIWEALQIWSRQTKSGKANTAPGIIFAEDDDVVPDVVWTSRERLAMSLLPDGHLHAAPELAVEILSPGFANERRDREIKLKLYSRRGVLEYWVVNWQERRIEVYRRKDAVLTLVETLYESDRLQSPILPGFTCLVHQLFDDMS